MSNDLKQYTEPQLKEVLLWFEVFRQMYLGKECRHAPSEDSDQPGHPPSLIRVFTVRVKKAWVLIYWVHSEVSDQTGHMPRMIRVFAGCTGHFVGFVMRQLFMIVNPNNIHVYTLCHSVCIILDVKAHCSNLRIITAIFSDFSPRFTGYVMLIIDLLNKFWTSKDFFHGI